MDIMDIATQVIMDEMPGSTVIEQSCTCHLNDAGSGHWSGCVNS